MYKLTIITPTHNRQVGIDIAHHLMEAQSYDDNVLWLIVDDAPEPCKRSNLHHEHIINRIVKRIGLKGEVGPKSLAANVMHGLIRVPENCPYVMIWEDDDYYAPSHIDRLVNLLHSGKSLVGQKHQYYYNIKERVYLQQVNVGSTLSATAFHRRHIPTLMRACQSAYKKNLVGIDRMFWDSIPDFEKIAHEGAPTCIGIKGLPGQAGIGHGHKPSESQFTYRRDPSGVQLEAWVGRGWADDYLSIIRTGKFQGD